MNTCPENQMPRVRVRSTPPETFQPAYGQRQKRYESLRAVALAMGLQPSTQIAANCTEAIRNRASKKGMSTGLGISRCVAGAEGAFSRRRLQGVFELPEEQYSTRSGPTQAGAAKRQRRGTAERTQVTAVFQGGGGQIAPPQVSQQIYYPRDPRLAQHTLNAPRTAGHRSRSNSSSHAPARPYKTSAKQPAVAGEPSRAHSMQQYQDQAELVQQLKKQVRELTVRVTKRDEEMEVMMKTVSHLISENSALKAAGQN
ncbi:hypothetical protein COCSUDRAFT_59965 [Coccomyxa subellipsoidea C-169]|uniref:Uncharacterized protein n=1 Tax=Coccomyxa subellipsoidea (strain C-169) TaxID=574566 RepID=I0YJT7_COCSC|nr:hypothetical protein COCSUDRAFT_59965 [Coccomyxa subellipsoidea C-169]EIE18656.1 hypothetical protein COCSUDRAFT_59965 [Coccomyxa subellipsoidea C-169]|eukprot:XP_005643200.1 hypothetical protein COCSUDRAFT_59965 [Coccomyxa subellipsoidea C-169]